MARDRSTAARPPTFLSVNGPFRVGSFGTKPSLPRALEPRLIAAGRARSCSRLKTLVTLEVAAGRG